MQFIYENNNGPERKWKGILRQFIPKDDGSEKDGWTKSSFKALTSSFERSNRGYTWNWDEQSLAGKLVGIIFRNEEWEYNGKHGWTARPYRACSTASIDDGTYYMPKDKPLKNSTSADSYAQSYGYQDNSYSSGFTPYQDEADLPF